MIKPTQNFSKTYRIMLTMDTRFLLSAYMAQRDTEYYYILVLAKNVILFYVQNIRCVLGEQYKLTQIVLVV